MDPRLEPFLQAATESAADQALTTLLAEAEPLIVRAIERRVHGGGPRQPDTEDAISEARANLIARLRRLRAGPAGLPPIGDFENYVRAVARTARALVVRRLHPRRAALVNRLQYLLENRTSQGGFTCWETPGGERWAGFACWRCGPTAPAPGTVARRGRLAAGPREAATEIFGMADPVSLPLAELLTRTFTWLAGPLPLRDLVDAVAEWLGILQPQGALPTGEEAGESSAELSAVTDPRPSPHDALRWREYLGWLWRETARLSLRQRTAFLLHSSCLHELELLGLASVRQVAERLEIPAEQMAGYWNALPLEDRVIAGVLGIENQQVINLRRVARDLLGRAWHEWLHGK